MTYFVEDYLGCIIVTGPVPISEMISIMGRCGDDGLVDPGLGKVYGASMVIGTKENLDTLRNDPRTAQLAHNKALAEAGSVPLSAAAQHWLEHGERGNSSETMFSRFTGVDLTDDPSHPYDGDDFRRCRLLLEAVPEFQAKLSMMKVVSTQWHSLVDSWQELCDLMDGEAPNWRQSEGHSRQLNAKMAEYLA